MIISQWVIEQTRNIFAFLAYPRHISNVHAYKLLH